MDILKKEWKFGAKDVMSSFITGGLDLGTFHTTIEQSAPTLWHLITRCAQTDRAACENKLKNPNEVCFVLPPVPDPTFSLVFCLDLHRYYHPTCQAALRSSRAICDSFWYLFVGLQLSTDHNRRAHPTWSLPLIPIHPRDPCDSLKVSSQGDDCGYFSARSCMA